MNGSGAFLVGVKGLLTGQRVSLGHAEVTLGRDPSNTIALADQQVSTRHARVFKEAGGWVVEDLGSTNGTFVNGNRFPRVTIFPGDEVTVGGQTFRLEVVGATPLIGGREVSRSERRNKWRGTEVSAGDAPRLYTKTGSDLDGCTGINLNYDFSGCLKWLIAALIIVLLAVLLGVLLMGLGSGLSALGGAFTGGPGGGVGGGGSSGAGSSGGQAPPPAGGQQQQQAPQDGKKPSNNVIEILQVKIDYVKRQGRSYPVVLIKWRNMTEGPVGTLRGDVVILDQSDRQIGVRRNTVLYHGEQVVPGEIHEDLPNQGGVLLDPTTISGTPAGAKVEVTEVKVN